MSIYNVVLQDQVTGEKLEVAYSIGWGCDKVPLDEIGKACAIEHRYASGHCVRDNEPSFNKLYQPISCELAVKEPVTT